MKKITIFGFGLGVFGFFAVPTLPAFAAVNYVRVLNTSLGTADVTVSVDDWQADIDTPRENNIQPNANYWWVTIDKVSLPQSSADLEFSQCLPSSTLSHTFTFHLEPQTYYAVNLWVDNLDTCLTSPAGAFDSDPYATNYLLEGDNSAGVPTFTLEPGPARSYTFGSFLPPIKSDGSGIYKKGKTLPIKFQLKDAFGNFVSDAVATISVYRISSGITGNAEIPFSSSAADAGNQFRYDLSADQYIFNLDTAKLAEGTWVLRISLDDGTVHEAQISIK